MLVNNNVNDHYHRNNYNHDCELLNYNNHYSINYHQDNNDERLLVSSLKHHYANYHYDGNDYYHKLIMKFGIHFQIKHHYHY